MTKPTRDRHLDAASLADLEPTETTSALPAFAADDEVSLTGTPELTPPPVDVEPSKLLHELPPPGEAAPLPPVLVRAVALLKTARTPADLPAHTFGQLRGSFFVFALQAKHVAELEVRGGGRLQGGLALTGGLPGVGGRLLVRVPADQRPGLAFLKPGETVTLSAEVVGWELSTGTLVLDQYAPMAELHG